MAKIERSESRRDTNRTRRFRIHSALWFCILSAASSSSLAEGFAGEWTQCIAVSEGRRWNIVYGTLSLAACRELAVKCTGDAEVVATYHSSSVIISAPYTRCDQSLTTTVRERPR